MLFWYPKHASLYVLILNNHALSPTDISKSAVKQLINDTCQMKLHQARLSQPETEQNRHIAAY